MTGESLVLPGHDHFMPGLSHSSNIINSDDLDVRWTPSHTRSWLLHARFILINPMLLALMMWMAGKSLVIPGYDRYLPGLFSLIQSY